MDKKRIYSLDILRVIAMIMIVMHHYQQITHTYLFAGKYTFLGFNIVVEFFFILSGFLAFKYVDKTDLSFIPFIKGKWLRLMPLVLITSIVYEVLLYVYNRVCGTEWLLGNKVSVWGILLNATGMSTGWVFESPGTNNPVWYVSVLILCYVIFYFLMYISKKKNIPVTYLFVGMVLLGVAIRTYEMDMFFLNQYAARGYYSFFTGLLLAQALNKKEITLKESLPALVIVAVILYGIIFQYNVLEFGFVYIMVFVFYPALIVLFLSKPIQKVFGFKMIGVLGEATYDVYLWHVPMMLAMYIVFKLCSVDLNLQYHTCLIWFTAGSLAVGMISHFLIDLPMQKLIRKKSV